MNQINISSNARTAFGVGLVVVAMLAGCAGSPPWGRPSSHPTKAQVQRVLARLDSYVYFPSYEIYYNRANGEYTSWDGRALIAGIGSPPRVPVEVLLASPSVALDFHDTPERHHAAVVRSNPRSWGRPAGVAVSVR